MYKAIILSFFLIISSVSAINAQDRDIDVRIGVGISGFKTESNLLNMTEYELNVKWTDYFTVAPSIVLNHGDDWDLDQANFFQANLNAFGSPFRNNRQNDFRIGGGLSFYKLNQVGSATRSAFGLSIIVEDSYMLSDRFFIGIKAFIQPYFDKDMNTGILLKAGFNL